MSHDDKKCSCGCSSLYNVVVTVPADGEDGTVHEVGDTRQMLYRQLQVKKNGLLHQVYSSY